MTTRASRRRRAALTLFLVAAACGGGGAPGTGATARPPGVPATGVPATVPPETVAPSGDQQAGPPGPVAEASSVPLLEGGLPPGAVPVRVSTAAPVRVTLADAAIDAPVLPRGTVAGTGEFDLPTDPSQVAWYRDGPRPGASGSAVLAAHVDYDGRLGAFAPLLDLEPGATVAVAYDDGTTSRFEVVDRRSYAKASLPLDQLFRRQGPPSLVLVTCGGAFDRARRSYEDNVVVTAIPAR